MNCGREDCTGIHSASHGHSYSEMCQGAKNKYLERRKQYSKIPGTYRYNYNHGIGKAGEVMRESARRKAQTPGTYRYKRGHGIGLPGLRAHINRITQVNLKARDTVVKQLQEAELEVQRAEEEYKALLKEKLNAS